MLKEDFGFSSEELHVFFSGHRGYHVHVETESVRTLDAAARKEIVDYVSGLGLMLLDEDIERKGSGRQNTRFFDFQDFGWRMRLQMGMEKFVMNATKEDLKAIGVRNYNVLKNRETISWMRLARHIRDLESAKIDTVVTTDLHRLIRMAGTLHGKTGLLKIEFPTSRIASFEPFKEAVAFKKGTARVSVSSAPEFRLNEEVFGPYRNQTVELPTAAAVLLVCKGRAEVLPD